MDIRRGCDWAAGAAKAEEAYTCRCASQYYIACSSPSCFRPLGWASTMGGKGILLSLYCSDGAPHAAHISEARQPCPCSIMGEVAGADEATIISVRCSTGETPRGSRRPIAYGSITCHLRVLDVVDAILAGEATPTYGILGQEAAERKCVPCVEPAPCQFTWVHLRCVRSWTHSSSPRENTRGKILFYLGQGLLTA